MELELKMRLPQARSLSILLVFLIIPLIAWLTLSFSPTEPNKWSPNTSLAALTWQVQASPSWYEGPFTYEEIDLSQWIVNYPQSQFRDGRNTTGFGRHKVSWHHNQSTLVLSGPDPSSGEYLRWGAVDVGLNPIFSIKAVPHWSGPYVHNLANLIVAGINTNGESQVIRVEFGPQVTTTTALTGDVLATAPSGACYLFGDIVGSDLWVYDSLGETVCAYGDGAGPGDFDAVLSSDFPFEVASELPGSPIAFQGDGVGRVLLFCDGDVHSGLGTEEMVFLEGAGGWTGGSAPRFDQISPVVAGGQIPGDSRWIRCALPANMHNLSFLGCE